MLRPAPGGGGRRGSNYRPRPSRSPRTRDRALVTSPGPWSPLQRTATPLSRQGDGYGGPFGHSLPRTTLSTHCVPGPVLCPCVSVPVDCLGWREPVNAHEQVEQTDGLEIQPVAVTGPGRAPGEWGGDTGQEGALKENHRAARPSMPGGGGAAPPRRQGTMYGECGEKQAGWRGRFAKLRWPPGPEWGSRQEARAPSAPGVPAPQMVTSGERPQPPSPGAGRKPPPPGEGRRRDAGPAGPAPEPAACQTPKLPPGPRPPLPPAHPPRGIGSAVPLKGPESES